MSDIHTVIFELEKIGVPLEKKLFPPSARTLHIFCDPEKYGWHPTEKQNGICHIDMKGFGFEPTTILDFIRIIETGSQVIPHLTLEQQRQIEHFAILIGAGGLDCPFRQATNEYKAQCQKIHENKYLYQQQIGPMTSAQDYQQLYKWKVAHASSAPLGNWSVTVPTIRGTQYYYYRQRKTVENTPIL